MSTLYHLAQTLAAERFLEQDPITKRYSLGPALLTIQSPAAARDSLTRLLYGPLQACSTSSGFDVWAGVLQHDRVMYVARAHGASPLKLELPLHQLLPAFCRASGRVLLASLPRDEVRSMLKSVELKRFTRATCVEPEELMRRIDMTRVDGFCEVVEEHVEGVREVAVPVVGQTGATVAAFVIGAPLNVFTANRRDEMVRHLTEAARTAEHAMGRMD
jgi:DNA-binding IclR family transcriptional regulator